MADYFHFKKFSVRHDRSGMKVGTDGALLGAWTDVRQATQLLDIGTGTGVIALMLAQRASESVTIDAVEIDDQAYADAQENIAASPWHDRINLHHASIQSFHTTTKFDLIVTNPPYFQKSYKPPTTQRETARHTEQLTYDEILNTTEKLLTPNGRLTLILPYTEGLQFSELDDKHGNIQDDSPHDASAEGQSVETVKKALFELPDGYRVVFSLYMLEGYDHQEIGEILGISEATSKSQYSRAKQRLRDILTQQKPKFGFGGS